MSVSMNSWERLEQVIVWSGLTVNAFALSLGLKRAENLYQIKKGRNSISRELAELIAKKYPGISKSWLLTGDGTMFSSGDREETEGWRNQKVIPFYGSFLPVLEGSGELRFPDPVSELVIPFLQDCDFAVTWSGDSMAPEIPTGAVVVLKETSLSEFFAGEIYLVYTAGYRIIRRVRTDDADESCLRLVPANRSSHDDAVVSRSAVRKLFLVKGLVLIRVF